MHFCSFTDFRPFLNFRSFPELINLEREKSCLYQIAAKHEGGAYPQERVREISKGTQVREGAALTPRYTLLLRIYTGQCQTKQKIQRIASRFSEGSCPYTYS